MIHAPNITFEDFIRRSPEGKRMLAAAEAEHIGKREKLIAELAATEAALTKAAAEHATRKAAAARKRDAAIAAAKAAGDAYNSAYAAVYIQPCLLHAIETRVILLAQVGQRIGPPRAHHADLAAVCMARNLQCNAGR